MSYRRPSATHVRVTFIVAVLLAVVASLGIGQTLRWLGVDGVPFLILGWLGGFAVGAIAGRISIRILWGRP